MPQRKKTSVICDHESIETAIYGTPATTPEAVEPPKPVGSVPRPRWIRATATWQADDDDSEPFSAEINVAGLTQFNTGWLWEPSVPLAEVWPFLSDRVRDWNAAAYDHKTRQWTLAQGPEEIGWKAFAMIDQTFTVQSMLLLAEALKGGDARKKFVATSESQPANGSEPS